MKSRRTFYVFLLSILGVVPLLLSQSSSGTGPGAGSPLFRRVDGAPRASSTPERFQHTTDTIRVLALMVDFQPDTDTLTSGNGKFELHQTDARLIDPPPRNAAFFSSKLQFLSNYFRRVSNGKVNVAGEVLGGVITLSKQLSAYAPPKDGSDNKRLVDMVVESWRKADSLNPGFPFSSYDAFVLFHAGVGRDIDLVSLLGFDPTPNDIHSITFNLKTFREYAGDPSFGGIAVTNGTFLITNTIVLPETETRLFRSGSRTDTLQLGLNGLLAASFGTFLGLPDLFDTKTGASAIGRFGLMDGAAIGAYNGLFPPEPSAWEKVYLGWVTPVTLNSGPSEMTLPAVGLTDVDDVIYKIPINEREYFLVENRIRDPHQNGQRLTIREGSVNIMRHFGSDTTGFQFDDVRAISGSVVDVEDFDWALPGYPDTSEVFRGGGLLIWHIDEGVIQRGLIDNTINADPNLRGVDLEEADGAQDIGQLYELLQAGFGAESGWPLDFWFQENPIPSYKNIFNHTSRPGSASNTGSRSLVTIKNISPRGPTMSALFEKGDDRIKPLAGFPLKIDGSISSSPIPFDLDDDGVEEIIVTRELFDGPGGRGGSPTGRGAVAAWRQDGTVFPSPFSENPYIIAEVDRPSIGSPVFLRHPTTGIAYLAVPDFESVYLWRIAQSQSGPVLQRQFKVPSTGLFLMFVDTTLLAYASSSGSVERISLDGSVQSIPGVGNNNFALARLGSGSTIAAVEQESNLRILDLATNNILVTVPIQGIVQHLVGGDVRGNGLSQAVCFVNKQVIPGQTVEQQVRYILIVDQQQTVTIPLNPPALMTESDEGFVTAPVLADLDGDGRKEILIVSSKGRLFGFNGQGVLVDGFPVALGLPAPAVLYGPLVDLGSPAPAVMYGPLVGDVNGDGHSDIVNIDANGDLWSYSPGVEKSAEMLFRAGDITAKSPSFFHRRLGASTTLGFISVDARGQIAAFDMSVPYSSLWPMYRYDPAGTAFASAVTPSPKPITSAFLPRSRVYNWPNPVYTSSTQIRYYTSEDAEISVKVFDLAGEKITELNARSTGGVDGEVRWDVSGVQSGVYLARVEATGNGRSEVAIIKIAVVK